MYKLVSKNLKKWNLISINNIFKLLKLLYKIHHLGLFNFSLFIFSVIYLENIDTASLTVYIFSASSF